MHNEWLELDGQPFAELDSELLPRMQKLWIEADRIWERFQGRPEFRGYVSADYETIYHELVRLRGRVVTVLEWGSGLGVVTIMANRLGFEAYGIEIEPRLVERSRGLAKKYGADARFVTGSFIPKEYEWNPEHGDENFRTASFEAEPGYSELEMELHDFDLVYAFPWPDEHTLYLDIMRQCGGEDSLFLSYDSREGPKLSRFGSTGFGGLR